MKPSVYEMVIGLEVHVELKTKTKIFCSCKTDFGAEPNTQCCPVCLGMPGSLPVLNETVVDYAVKAGMATHCEILQNSKQDRKNYFYPDLPKAYQISQYDLPLCRKGFLEIETGSGPKQIGITRIHIEEDAGKLVHVEGGGTLVDCNRCGVPLIEIVSEPDVRSAEEAKAYLQKLRAVLLYTGISDCKMQEGSLRCDVNLSIHKPGEPFGARTEMKNLNSFQNIVKAIEFEYARQVDAVEHGESIVQETRRFDAASGKTYPMRRKEEANDYRYFPDPDLVPIRMPSGRLRELREEIPALPDERKQRYVDLYGISSYAAEQLVTVREAADYFEAVADKTEFPVLAANLVLSELFRLAGPVNPDYRISPAHLASVAQMQGEGRINSNVARKVLEVLWEQDQDPIRYVQQQNLEQISDETVLRKAVLEVLARQEKAVMDYRNGRVNAFQSLVGQVMRETSGKGNPIKIQEIIKEILSQ